MTSAFNERSIKKILMYENFGGSMMVFTQSQAESLTNCLAAGSDKNSILSSNGLNQCGPLHASIKKSI